MELTLLSQAIKVLSYTHIQAIMQGVEEIQMSRKKTGSSATMVRNVYHTVTIQNTTISTKLISVKSPPM